MNRKPSTPRGPRKQSRIQQLLDAGYERGHPAYRRMTKYDLTVEQAVNIPLNCQICGEISRLDVDHDHKTHKFRGWLCRNCNFGIGHFKEKPELLEKAFRYLTLNPLGRKPVNASNLTP